MLTNHHIIDEEDEKNDVVFPRCQSDNLLLHSKVRNASVNDSIGTPDIAFSTWATSSQAKEALISAMSGLYAMLLVIMSLSFEVAILVVETMEGSNYDFFYIYMYTVALLFMGYVYFFMMKDNQWMGKCSKDKGKDQESDRKASIFGLTKRKATHSAQSAGSLYLRLGCVVFGVVGLISKGYQLFSYFNAYDPSCFNAGSVVETALGGTFIFVQMFFIFENSKLIIHRFKSMARVGMMHCMAANLCMWIRSLVEEQYNIIVEVNEGHGKDHKNSTTETVRELIQHTLHIDLNLTDSFVHYEPMENPCRNADYRRHTDDRAGDIISEFRPLMTTCIIEYSLICSAINYILWRNIGQMPKQRARQRKQRFHVDCTASSKGLFVGLLFMVMTIISVLIFFTKLRSQHNHEALWVFYASDSFLYVVSILAILIAYTRLRHLYYVPRSDILVDDSLLIVGLFGQLTFCVFSVVPLHAGGLTTIMVVVTSLLRMIEVLLQTTMILFGQRLTTMHTSVLRDQKPGRELVTFLLMTNLSMFLINTFETQKAGSNPLMTEFYGEGIWTVIVHSTTPLRIFYRFHSTVCLAEIWKQAYRVKDF